MINATIIPAYLEDVAADVGMHVMHVVLEAVQVLVPVFLGLGLELFWLLRGLVALTLILLDVHGPKHDLAQDGQDALAHGGGLAIKVKHQEAMEMIKIPTCLREFSKVYAVNALFQADQTNLRQGLIRSGCLSARSERKTA